MSELSKIIIRSGILSPEQLNEFQRWGFPQNAVEGTPPEDLQHFVQQVELALQAEDMVLVRETDLEILQTFLRSQLLGTMHLDDGVTSADGLPVRYVVLRTGEYVIPWLDDAISEMFVNDHSYLTTPDGLRVYFGNVRELFYGEAKAFAVCTPVVLDHMAEPPTVPLLPSEEDNGHSAANNGT